jgi:hypothetical protein
VCACLCPSNVILQPLPSPSHSEKNDTMRTFQINHSPPLFLRIAQVLIIEFELINNSLEMLHAAIDESGLNQYVYRRSTDASASCKYRWPTLESLIVNNTCLVIFAHGNGMDSSCASVVCREEMFYTFDHFQQTNWNDNSYN